MWIDDAVDRQTARVARRLTLSAPGASAESIYHGPDRTLYMRAGDGRIARVKGNRVELHQPTGTWVPQASTDWSSFRA